MIASPEEHLIASPSQLKAIFQILEDGRKQTAERRAVVEMCRNLAPFEAIRCLRLLDEIQLIIDRIETRVLAASDGELVPPIADDMVNLQRLAEHFSEIAGAFSKEASLQLHAQ